MTFLIAQGLFLFAAVLGLLVWASADLPLALREIAVNTRRDPEGGSGYPMIRVLSVFIRIFAVLIWAGGIIGVVAVVIGSPILSGIR